MRRFKTGCVRSASLKPGSNRAQLTRSDQVTLTAGSIMIPVGISLLDPEEDETARGLTRVTGLLGPVDLARLIPWASSPSRDVRQSRIT